MNRRLFFIILCFSSLAISAQETKESKRESFEKFKQRRMEYISSEMNLSANESTAFWPVCDELQHKKFELNRSLRQEIRKLQEKEKQNLKPTQAEYDKLIMLNADVKIKETELDKEYLLKFKKIISPEQIHKYQQAEMRFARKMMYESRDEPRELNDNRGPEDRPRKSGSIFPKNRE